MGVEEGETGLGGAEIGVPGVGGIVGIPAMLELWIFCAVYLVDPGYVHVIVLDLLTLITFSLFKFI